LEGGWYRISAGNESTAAWRNWSHRSTFDGAQRPVAPTAPMRVALIEFLLPPRREGAGFHTPACMQDSVSTPLRFREPSGRELPVRERRAPSGSRGSGRRSGRGEVPTADRCGTSAPQAGVYRRFGLTVGNLVATVSAVSFRESKS